MFAQVYSGAVYGVDASAVSAANAVGPMLGAFLAAGVFGLAALGVFALVPWQKMKSGLR